MSKHYSDTRQRKSAKYAAIHRDLLDNLIFTKLRRAPTKTQRHKAASDKFRRTGE